MFFKYLLNLLQIILFLIGCYYFAVALFSLAISEKKHRSAKENTFALIVAAHNEESVIAELVSSLKALDYPGDKFEIFVVADNCTDKTAELAKEQGAIVLERFDTQRRGKGYAMEFAFEHIFSLDREYEYICIFDADNIVKNDFLRQMNNKINEGYRAVQGYLDSKNPTDNWLTFSYSLWYWINNRMSQLARENLDIGCRLGGTGFAVESALIKKYGWGATCLAEDTEFTLKLALNDIKVGWAHGAVVYDEKPTLLGTSIHQRKRWMQGLSEVATRYVKPLLQKGFKEKSPDAFHMLMNFWGDSLYPISVGFFWGIYILALFLSKSSPVFSTLCGMWDGASGMLILSVFTWGNLFLMLAGLYSDHKLDKNIMKNSLGFLVYILSWIPIGIMGFLKKDEKEWFHTPHSGKRN
ncbi:MAG: glycosyltransferase family 2 protein [Clostridia bacterium]|nr:glycosyltransferase family 2 protein [Clostridia bacterium]